MRSRSGPVPCDRHAKFLTSCVTRVQKAFGIQLYRRHRTSIFVCGQRRSFEERARIPPVLTTRTAPHNPPGRPSAVAVTGTSRGRLHHRVLLRRRSAQFRQVRSPLVEPTRFLAHNCRVIGAQSRALSLDCQRHRRKCSDGRRSAHLATSTSAVAELGAWLSRDVPWSRVRRLALP